MMAPTDDEVIAAWQYLAWTPRDQLDAAKWADAQAIVAVLCQRIAALYAARDAWKASAEELGNDAWVALARRFESSSRARADEGEDSARVLRQSSMGQITIYVKTTVRNCAIRISKRSPTPVEVGPEPATLGTSLDAPPPLDPEALIVVQNILESFRAKVLRDAATSLVWFEFLVALYAAKDSIERFIRAQRNLRDDEPLTKQDRNWFDITLARMRKRFRDRLDQTPGIDPSSRTAYTRLIDELTYLRSAPDLAQDSSHEA